jgi:hypothetical protein
MSPHDPSLHDPSLHGASLHNPSLHNPSLHNPSPHSTSRVMVWGVDFTSAPRAKKPIVAVAARVDAVIDAVVDAVEVTPLELLTFTNLNTFTAWLNTHPAGVMAIDAPFGQPRRLLETWHITQNTQSWADYVARFACLSKADFEAELNGYRAGRAQGDKHHLRRCDVLAKACSPMMLYGVPVAKMFFVLAPLLLEAGVNVPPVHETSSRCSCVEGYPALVVKALCDGKIPPYKSDTRSKQTSDREDARATLLHRLHLHRLQTGMYGLRVRPSYLDEAFIKDPSGDALDALLACVQAAWAAQQDNFGIPPDTDALEGWIVDPSLR